MTRRRPHTLWLLAVLCACTTTHTATQVMVLVDAEPDVVQKTHELHIVVSGGSDSPTDRTSYDRKFTAGRNLEWPRLVALAPAHADAERLYQVVATARDVDGEFVSEVRAVSGYVAHRRLELELVLEDKCIAKMCGNRTCKDGSCRSATVDPAQLKSFSPDHAALHDRDASLDGAVAPDAAAVDASAADASDAAGNDASDSSAATGVETCNGMDDDEDGDTDEETRAYCESVIAHAEVRCDPPGICVQVKCLAGFADCDGRPQNGCEHSLSGDGACPKCDQDCDAQHSSAVCESGKCVLTSCENGFDDCNGKPGDGCETALDSSTDCGKCDNECPAGKACKNGGCECEDDRGCADGASCCDGACVYTNGSCFEWPCIPGTTADKNNCGACGQGCLMWCCF